MRNFFKNSVLALSITAVVGGGAIYTPQAQAFACANCASEFTQMMNNFQLLTSNITQAQQLVTLFDQYSDMVKQGMGLSDSVFDSLTDDLQDLVSLYQSGTSLAHRMADIDERFRDEFKGYENYLASIGQGNMNMSERYRKWADYGFDNTRLAMRSAQMQTSILNSEDAMLYQLVQRSATAQGRLQAIQAGNEIAAQQVQQMQKLREMIATQITLQGNWMAQQVERQAVDDAFVETFKNGQVQHGQSRGY
jgi:P-type conjugative transfer protein TrbJ